MTTTTPHRLVYFGTDAFSVPPLVQLLAANWSIVAVVTKPDSHTGRGQELSMPAVKRLALAAGIPVLQPAKSRDAADDLKALHPDAGIVVAYGKIIPSAVIDLFPQGLINVHPSLLPRYRGATPIESAILNGDAETGVTLMQIDAGTDTGPTYDTVTVQLTGTETRPELYAQLGELGAEFLSTKLPLILSGTIVSIPQDSSLATHTDRISKSAGQLDWHKPAVQLEREVRAYLGWPGSYAKIAGVQVIVTAAHAAPKDGAPAGTAYVSPSSELAVYTGGGSLVIDRLKPAGKREMTGLEFLAGHPLG